MTKKESPLLTFDVAIERFIVLRKIVRVEDVSSQKAEGRVLEMEKNHVVDWFSPDVKVAYDLVELPEHEVPRRVKKGEM